METHTSKDFFISYTGSDKKWAEWIAWQLEEAHYTVILQAWDFRPGTNFVLQMDQAAKAARCTLLVLSPAYLNARYTQPEWAVAFRSDPQSVQRAVLPVRVQQCEVDGLLGPIVYIDLVDLEEEAAREALMAGIKERGKPETAPSFPGSIPRTVAAPERFPGLLPACWNVPYARNPYFTGREDLLQLITEALRTNSTAAITQPQAISGLGGIGKTQCAIEYAYRSHPNYQAVLWVGAETREQIIKDFVAIAALLELPQQDAQDQNEAVKAVTRWLKTHHDWLLILDNADNLAMVRDFLPPSLPGHLLMTTRAQAMGRIAHRFELERMEPAEGALFLLRRAGLIGERDQLEQASEAQRDTAQAISQALDGLPLALDQAGAYIEETGCRLAAYLTLFQQRSAALLARRGGINDDHPKSVATTWSLSFEKVEQANPASADLLRLCAFLAPDAIPEEIVSQGASELSPLLQPVATDALALDAAIEEVRKYSLMKRDPELQTLTMHRLVQAVIRDGMEQTAQRQWAERAIRAANAARPAVEHGSWPAWERIVSHAQACAELQVLYNIQLPEAAELLQRTGWYLTERARYPEAQPLLEQAYALSVDLQGLEHLDTARDANTLAALYYQQGQFEQAEPLLHRALEIREQQLGAMHPVTAISLNNLAVLYYQQGKFEQAELLYQRSLSIDEQIYGKDHPVVATDLNNLAALYYQQGKFEQAELLYQRALEIREQQLGAMHPDTATSLNNLAGLYQDQGKFEQAEPLFQRALEIREQQLGAMHPDTAASLNNLAMLYKTQGLYEQAEPLYLCSLEIREQQLGAMHPDTAISLNNLAMLYYQQGKFEEAEPLFQRALAICEQQLGAMHPDTAQSLNNLASLYHDQGKYEQAEPLFQRALVIREQQLGAMHPDTATSLNNLAELYRALGKFEQAEPLYQRALAIYTQVFGPQHPGTKTIQRNYDIFLEEKQQKRN